MVPDTKRRAHSPLLNLPISKTINTTTTAQHSNNIKAPPKIITTTDPPKQERHEEIEPTTNVHGYIACSPINNAIEINLRFPKCKCPENGGNRNNKNINSKNKKVDNPSSNDTDDSVDVINSEEIKTKIINFDRNNLCNIVNNLDINTCTKCSISLDVKRLLTRIFSNPALNSDNLNGSCRSFIGDGASLLSASISPRLSESTMSATTDHDDFIIFNLNKQHQQKRNSADKRSTGTQHEEPLDNKSPNNQGGGSKNKEVYVITDEFKKKCTEHHIIVKRNTANQKKKRPFSRSLENLSTPEVQRREFITTTTNTNGQTKCDFDLTNGAPSNNAKRNGKISETKNRSKSVDDISTSSNEVLEGVDSVELIFISDEFLSKSNKEEPEVIIVDPSPRPTPSPNSQSGDEKLTNGKPSSRKSSQKSDKSPKDKKLYVISDDYKKRSLNNTVIVVKQREKKKTVNAKPEANPKNVDETLALNLKKTTATNSNTFLTYEEPFSPIYDLEDKEIP